MHGDYTRSPYRPGLRYSSVRMQQGRVWLDGDWNEQIELADHRRRTLVGDVVGCCGAPAGAAGFAVAIAPVLGGPPDLLLSAGRVWAGGLLCELPADPPVAVTGAAGGALRLDQPVVAGRDLAPGQWVEIGSDEPEPDPPTVARISTVTAADDHTEIVVDRPHPLAADQLGRLRRLISYRTQPDLPAAALLEPTTDTRYLAYLEVRERHLSALEEPRLREVALGGPDTTTRTQVLGQVKLLALSAEASVPRCRHLGPCWSPPADGPAGRLAARAEPDQTAPTPCAVPEEAGFRGLGNQSYLVQVRGGGTAFVFSRDHGSVTHPVATVGADGTVVLAAPAADRYRTVRGDDWLELVDDELTLSGVPGPLVRVDAVEDDGSSFTTDPPLPALPAADARRRHTYLRRWDQRDGTAADGTLALTTGGWIPLEEGVQVRFEDGGHYRDLDFWTIPARTAIGDAGGDVLWPRDGTEPRFEPPHGPRRGFCALAVLVPDGAGSWTVERCLPEFVPAAEQVSFDLVGGDGQQGLPGEQLTTPLQVRVARGGLPLAGALVQFTVEAGTGTLATAQPVQTTGPHGIAEATLRLGAAGPHRVRATLLAGDDPTEGRPGAVAVFTAAAVPPPVAAGGGCERTVGPNGEFPTLLDALVALRGTAQVCLCLEGTDHEVGIGGPVSGAELEIRSLTITGCGPVSRLVLTGPLTIAGFDRLRLADLAVVAREAAPRGAAALTVRHCRELALTRCWVASPVVGPIPTKIPSGAALSVERVPLVRIRDCTVEAFHPNFDDERGTLPAKLIDAADPTALLIPLFIAQRDNPAQFAGPVFADAAWQVALKLAPDLAARGTLAQNLDTVLGQLSPSQPTPLELTALQNLADVLVDATVTAPQALVTALEAVRRAAVRSDAAVALVLDPGRDEARIVPPGPAGGEHIVVSGCDVLGALSLGGPTTTDGLSTPDIEDLDPRAAVGIVPGRAGTVRLQGNTLDQLTVGFTLWKPLTEAFAGPYQTVPSTLQLVDNTVTTRRHVVLARRLAVSGNTFTVGAERADDATVAERLGYSLADSATFLGNHGTLVIGKPLDWHSATRTGAEQVAHNIDLNVS